MTRDLKNTNYVNTHASRLLGTDRLVWVILRAPNSCRSEVLNPQVNAANCELYICTSIAVTITSLSLSLTNPKLFDLIHNSTKGLNHLNCGKKKNIHFMRSKNSSRFCRQSSFRFLLDKQKCCIMHLYLAYAILRDGHTLLPSEGNFLHATNRL